MAKQKRKGKGVSKKSRKGTKGLLIKGILEKVPSNSFEILRDELKNLMKDSSGVYALYKDDKLYYVGLAGNLNNRLFTHIKKSRRTGKWNKFSIFFVQRMRLLKDMETLVLRIARPPGNRVLGKVPEHYKLSRQLRRTVKELRVKADKISKALQQ